jgi:hypothetical protein
VASVGQFRWSVSVAWRVQGARSSTAGSEEAMPRNAGEVPGEVRRRAALECGLSAAPRACATPGAGQAEVSSARTATVRPGESRRS